MSIEICQQKDWPHAPIHRFNSDGIYMVTGSTLYKRLFFRDSKCLTMLESKLLSLARKYAWQLEAWSVFSNHYHFIGRNREESADLGRFLKHFHADTARDLNKYEQLPGRQVWFNFWDKKLTYETSYLARLNYVHQNPVKHGLVNVANQYPWCSAAWFERTASRATVKTVYSFKTDKLNILDDF